MQSAPLPAEEFSRKAALDALAVLDTPAEREFDDLVIAASLACGVPISLISLVDSHRQWFKANVGLPGVSETPRDVAFCAHAILDDGVFEVPNALEDARFADNPLVAEQPDIRFYAGAPITLKDGSRVGTLCLIDRIPHQLSDAQREILLRLASAAARALETRQAEIQLKSERQKLEEILSGTAAGTWLWDVQTGHAEFNERWADMLGKSLSELQPVSIQTWIDHVHPDDLPAAQAALNRHFDGEAPSYECEIRMRRKDGGWVWVYARGKVVLRDAAGRALRISGIHLDVSARHEAEEAATRADRYLQNTLNAVPYLIAYWDVNLINRFANHAYSSYFGITPEQALGQHISKILGEAIYQKNLPFIQAALRGEQQDFERILPSRDGKSERFTLSKYLPDLVNGKVQGFYVFVFDVTELKEAQQNLIELNRQLERRTSEAEAANAYKSQFLANMSHEIRTPMNAVLGMLSLLESTDLTDRQRDYATKADGAARSLLSLLNDILDLSKVEAGKMTLESQPFRFDTLLRSLSVVLSSNIKSKNVEVLFDISPQLPEVVVGDSLRLQQILTNLGGNAVKFTEKGQVVIALQVVRTNPKSVVIAFSVQDSGIGIAPEHQARIFTGFSQAEASTTRRFGGTGLGLAISKSMVELMGGALNVQSERGVGSTFGFEVELQTVDAIPDALQAPDRLALGNQWVLIVDDNPVARGLLLNIVQTMGWQADCVASGADAVAQVHRARDAESDAFPYSVVLIDWQIAGMDGWEIARKLREFAHTCTGAAPTIIMLSANGKLDLASRSEEEQALVSGFVVKPVTASMVLDAVMDAGSESPSIRRFSAGRFGKRQLAGMRILVVEDNLINQQIAEELLSAEGALISLAANGQLGVDAVRAAAPQFDAVLMDVQMPVMDGYAATRAIRTELWMDDLPIIAMTANAMPGDRESCIAAGMNEHIGKPFDMAKLVSVLIATTGFRAPDVRVSSNSSRLVGPGDVPNIDGLELKEALARMSGARFLYRRTAQDYLQILSRIQADLQEDAKGSDRKAAARTLHTLKGNAATLGLTALEKEAKRLERLWKSGVEIDAFQQDMDGLGHYIGQAQSLLNKAIAELDAVPPQQDLRDAARMPLPDKDGLVETLQALGALLEQSDMEALQKFAEVRAQLEALPDGLFDALDAALQDMEFQTALDICLKAQAVLNG